MRRSTSRSPARKVWTLPSPIHLFLLLFRSAILSTAAAARGTANGNLVLPLEACIDFATGQFPDSPWTLGDCLEVWDEYADTIPPGLHPRLPFVDTWRATATQLRSAGSPCLAASNTGTDGVGSSAIRYLSAWIFAEEMDCDWVTPDWGKRHVAGGNGSVVYCHRAATIQEAGMPLTKIQMQDQQRCAVVDWISYFQFGAPSVGLPRNGTAKVIQASFLACRFRNA